MGQTRSPLLLVCQGRRAIPWARNFGFLTTPSVCHPGRLIEGYLPYRPLHRAPLSARSNFLQMLYNSCWANCSASVSRSKWRDFNALKRASQCLSCPQSHPIWHSLWSPSSGAALFRATRAWYTLGVEFEIFQVSSSAALFVRPFWLLRCSFGFLDRSAFNPPPAPIGVGVSNPRWSRLI